MTERRSGSERRGEPGAPFVRHETLCPGGLVVPPAPSVYPEEQGTVAFSSSDRFLVVMPTYDERDNLPRIVPLVLDEDPRIEVLVVDDNSPDGTGLIWPKRWHVTEPRLHALRRGGQERVWVGPTWQAFGGRSSDGYRLVFEMDADMSHDPERLSDPHRRGVARLERGRDRIAVCRRGRVNVVNWPMGRLLISYFGSFYARTITGLPVRDATGGFNCFRREVLESLDLGRMQSNGYAFQIELKLRAFRRGFRLVEVPIVFIERETGESKMSSESCARPCGGCGGCGSSRCSADCEGG